MNSNLMDIIHELYKQWCRLKGYSLPKTNLDHWFDEKSGIQDQNMREFTIWLNEEILTRIEPATPTNKSERKV